MRNLRLTSAALLTFAVVVAACAPGGPAAGSPSSGGQPKRGGTLILARSGEVTNLDPHKVPAFTSARVFELVYSYLMRLDENLGVQPDLAASMPTTSADGKTVTVKLRTGVKFHNGDPLTSADVKYTFDRIIDPKTAAVARSFFTDVDTITAPIPVIGLTGRGYAGKLSFEGEITGLSAGSHGSMFEVQGSVRLHISDHLAASGGYRYLSLDGKHDRDEVKLKLGGWIFGLELSL